MSEISGEFKYFDVFDIIIRYLALTTLENCLNSGAVSCRPVLSVLVLYICNCSFVVTCDCDKFVKISCCADLCSLRTDAWGQNEDLC